MGAEYRVRRKNHGALDKILKFPNVAGPAVAHQCIHRLRGDVVDAPVHTPRVECGEVPDQFRNIFRALP